MSGFTGELRTDGARADAGAVDRMASSMDSRGPDGAGIYAHQNVALGHRRLKTIDLSERAAQPMVDAELGLAVAVDGAIYNYPALRDELQSYGYRFFSDSDTEVIGKAYHHWGDGFVERLTGMFSFVITERDSGRMLLGRDRLGVRPLYLSERNGRLRFASTLPAILAAGEVDTTIDVVALHHYLTFHAVVPPPYTILKGVRKLPPATTLAIEPDGRRHERRYWSIEFARRADRADWTVTDWQDAVLDALRAAVDRRRVADVPVGVLLSGGLDSSLIVGLLAEAGETDLPTFSVGFDTVGGEEGDEFKYSDVIVREFATNHQQIRVNATQMLPALHDAVTAMSEPMVSHDAIGFYLLSQQVAKSVRVVQSGQGADEVFGGYHWYPPLLDVDDEGVSTYAQAFCDRDHDEMARLVSPDYLVEHDVSRRFVAEHFAEPGAQTPVDRALRIDATTMAVDDPIKRVDNMTMAWGLEARMPFLDHELVELAASAPPELHLEHGGKGILKEAARRLIPAEVIDRPKGYFPVPALKYLQGEYLELVRDAVNSQSARTRGLFQPEEVNRLLEKAEAGEAELTPLRGNKLWQLGLLELWLSKHGI